MSFDGDLYPEAGATSVLTTKGDIVRYNSARERYGIGSANQILQVKSSLPSWETVPLADTVLTTAGDILYENNTPELARLPKGSDADVLTLASGLPSWSAPAGGGLWESAYDDAWTSASTIDTGTVTFKKYISMWIAISGMSNVNYKWEALFNNDSSSGDYNSKYFQNSNQGTRLAQSDLNLVEGGGTNTTDAIAYCQVNIINKNNMPKVGFAQAFWFSVGEAAGYFNRSSVWFLWDNNALLTQIEIDPDTFGGGETFSLGEVNVFHTDG